MAVLALRSSALLRRLELLPAACRTAAVATQLSPASRSHAWPVLRRLAGPSKEATLSPWPVHQRRSLFVLSRDVVTSGFRVLEQRRSLSALSEDVAKSGFRVYVKIMGTLDDGAVFDDSVERGAPLDFILGFGQVPKGLDAGVEGMRVGETRELRVEASAGFGERDPECVWDVAIDRLPLGCEVGTKLSVGGGNKGPPARVSSIGETTATLDMNHPLAGKALNYVVTLLECDKLPAIARDVTSPGDGKTYPKKGDELTMHYIGSLASNGEVFDSSRTRDQPFSFKVGVGQVIKGWDHGVMQMSLGERSILRIPSELGYGSKGAGNSIPPDADLVFDAELLKIN